MLSRVTRWWIHLNRQGPPRSPIAELAAGSRAKVIGRAVPIDEPILAPFSGRSCVTFNVVAKRFETTGRTVREVLVADEDGGLSFFLRDETGVARVYRGGWSALCTRDRTFNSPSGGVQDNLDRFFERYGHDQQTFFDGFHDCYYVERIVEVEATVAAVGHVRDTGEPVPDFLRASYRHTPRLMALEPGEDEKLIISDAPVYLCH